MTRGELNAKRDQLRAALADDEREIEAHERERLRAEARARKEAALRERAEEARRQRARERELAKRRREAALAREQRRVPDRIAERSKAQARRRVYLEHVLVLVAWAGTEHYGTSITREAILSSTSKARVVACRRVAVYLLAELGMAWADISTGLNRKRFTFRAARVARLSVDELLILDLALDRP